MKKINKHIPVLLNETIKNLNLKDDGVYVDATLGMGGYTRKILDNSNCTLIGIDRVDGLIGVDGSQRGFTSKYVIHT